MQGGAPMADQKAISEADKKVLAETARRTRRGFLSGGAVLAALAIGYRIFDRAAPIGMLRRPLRAAEDLNAAIAEHLLGEKTLAVTYPAQRATHKPMPYGDVGLRKDLDPASWRLQLTGLEDPQRHAGFVPDVAVWQYRYAAAFEKAAEGVDRESGSPSFAMENKLANQEEGSQADSPTASLPAGKTPGLLLTLADLQKLPFVEQATEFKCIEGWSQIVHFGGVRFRDFMEAYPPRRTANGALPGYAAISTPDGTFYGGYEMAALLHPQTLLCFQMSGKDLTPAHGAPLRLAMPLKYGYKQIKQIGRITYTDTKPADYWASKGYDWHGGL